MDASLSDVLLPILVFCFIIVGINAGVLWLVMNVFMGSRGDGPFWKCLLCSLLLPVAIILAIILPGKGLYTLVAICVLGGATIRVVFKLSEGASISIFVVFALTSLASYFVLGLLGFDPGKVAVKTMAEPHKGLNKAQFRDQMKGALIERLEGEYNVGFDLPDDPTDEDEELDFAIKPHDGHFRLAGSVDATFDKTLKLTPQEAANWLAEDVALMNKYDSVEAYVGAVKEGKKKFAPGSERFKYYPVPEDVAKFLKNAVPVMTPTTATVAMLKNWETSGAEGLTSTTASADPTAWELALNTQDLAAYQATLDPSQTKQEDHRKEGPGEPDRVKTMLNEIFVTPAGNVEIMVKVHREARTAAEDVYNNKLILPYSGKTKAGILHTEALIPALTFGGDHYVSLIGEQQLGRPRYFICMEGFCKEVWYRIKAPVQPTAEQTAKLYRLMTMQKLKITRMIQS